MADNTRKSDNERENAVSDENEATSNVTSTTREQRGDDVRDIYLSFSCLFQDN